MKTDPRARRVADAVNAAYTAIPAEHCDTLDNLRQTIGGLLADLGLCSYDNFDDIARTIRPD